MTDCFDSKDPTYCQGLGSKLKILGDGVSGSETPNNCVEFATEDWIDGGKYYFLGTPQSVHDKGEKPIVSIQESVSGGVFTEVGVEKLFFEDGSIEIRVACDPDCRFEGRFLFDG